MAPEYLDTALVTATKRTEPPVSRSRSGYGSKLPTALMLRIAGRWHRVYAICWSNSATSYVIVGGKRLLLESGHRLGEV